MDPPRPGVDWERVSHYTFIEEFSLLQDTRNDLTGKAWARPDVRETMRMCRRVDRAQEEIKNANHEVRRLHTSIRDEELAFSTILAILRARHDPHLGAVEDFVVQRRGANARNLAYIEHVHALEGYTGERAPGRRVGGPEPMDIGPDTPDILQRDRTSVDSQDSAEDVLLEDDDEVNDELTSMLEYLASLTM